ncbi:hypothetical protein AB0H12_08700 [Actinosynnema sp. NPDC023794]
MIRRTVRALMPYRFANTSPVVPSAYSSAIFSSSRSPSRSFADHGRGLGDATDDMASIVSSTPESIISMT